MLPETTPSKHITQTFVQSSEIRKIISNWLKNVLYPLQTCFCHILYKTHVEWHIYICFQSLVIKLVIFSVLYSKDINSVLLFDALYIQYTLLL